MDIRLISTVLIADMGVWAYRRHVPLRDFHLIKITELPRLLTANTGLQLLDVRDYMEYEKEHYPSSINISSSR